MALDSNPRVFKLVVSDVDVCLADNGVIVSEDEVQIIYNGKVLPSTRKRIEAGLRNVLNDKYSDGLVQEERKLA